MPIYEYQCRVCGERCEILQKINEPLTTKCPNCQAEPAQLNRLVSAAGFQLKGTGWYVTDFRDKKPPEKKAPEEEQAPKSEKSDDNTKTKSTESKTKET